MAGPDEINVCLRARRFFADSTKIQRNELSVQDRHDLVSESSNLQDWTRIGAMN